jgi:predicted nucleic acid-binding protein
MIAADTSTWVAYLEGATEIDAELLRQALSDKQTVMAPVVLSELLSDPKLPSQVAASLAGLPLIQTTAGYWQRAGLLRAKVLSRGRRARLGDALVAQSCIDEGVTLLTRDRDFRAFAQTAGLGLVLGSRNA